MMKAGVVVILVVRGAGEEVITGDDEVWSFRNERAYLVLSSSFFSFLGLRGTLCHRLVYTVK